MGCALVTAITPFCKAGHSTKQFSCLHPLTAKEAAKNWSYPAVSWQRAQRNLATTAALETRTQHLLWEHQPCLYSHARAAAVGYAGLGINKAFLPRNCWEATFP